MADATERRALLMAIRRLARVLDLQSRRIDRELGLTLPQYVVLSAVRDLRNGTGREIAAAADVTPATIVGILDKLESKGLIERTRSTTDRRSVHTRLTAAGAGTLARIPFPLGSAFEAAFSALEPETRARTIRALNDLAELAAAEGAALEARLADEAGPEGPAALTRR
jgi:DNA-binding MarR family transcriptional regulator